MRVARVKERMDYQRTQSSLLAGFSYTFATNDYQQVINLLSSMRVARLKEED